MSTVAQCSSRSDCWCESSTAAVMGVQRSAAPTDRAAVLCSFVYTLGQQYAVQCTRFPAITVSEQTAPASAHCTVCMRVGAQGMLTDYNDWTCGLLCCKTCVARYSSRTMLLLILAFLKPSRYERWSGCSFEKCHVTAEEISLQQAPRSVVARSSLSVKKRVVYISIFMSLLIFNFSATNY